MKSPPAFISIANQDIKGESINGSTERQLENSHHAFGDKKVVESMLVRALLNETKSDSGKSVNKMDVSYLKLIDSCPSISIYRTADPLLLCISVIHCYVVDTKLPITEGYNQYLEWQKANLLHSPWGINEAAAYLLESDKVIWDLTYTKNWVKKYPEEFRFALNYYKEAYSKWKATAPTDKNSPKDLLITLQSKLGAVKDNELAPYFDSSYFNKSFHKNILPSVAEMKNDPKHFIIDTYENLLFRKPTDEELNWLLKFIANNKNLSPQLFYYSLMTSEEYKYY